MPGIGDRALWMWEERREGEKRRREEREMMKLAYGPRQTSAFT
jgi:hypothetical protein